MPILDHLRTEQEFHDRQAEQRALGWVGNEQSLCFADARYLDHESWIRPALDWLEPVQGLPTLDLGCGHGMAAVVLARRGAQVTGMELSPGFLKEARARAGANQVNIHFVQGNAEYLPFADTSFARIWGNAILHHLDLERMGAELWRVLRPGGRAVFCEPWGGNPLLDLARRQLPYPGKARTPDEQPLKGSHIRTLARYFPDLQVEGHQLLGMAGRILGQGRLQQGLGWFDQCLLQKLPGLKRLCRYVVLKLQK